MPSYICSSTFNTYILGLVVELLCFSHFFNRTTQNDGEGADEITMKGEQPEFLDFCHEQMIQQIDKKLVRYKKSRFFVSFVFAKSHVRALINKQRKVVKNSYRERVAFYPRFRKSHHSSKSHFINYEDEEEVFDYETEEAG